jgi:magnesium transporter
MEAYIKSSKDKTFRETTDFKNKCWIHIDEATLEDLNTIKELTGIDIIHLQDSLDKYELPRIECNGKNIFIFVRYPFKEEKGLHTGTLTLIMTRSHFITICPSKSCLVKNFLQFETKISTSQKSLLLFYFLLKITQSFTSEIKQVHNSVLEIANTAKNITNNTIIALTKNEDILNQYIAALIPMRNVLEVINSGRFIKLYKKENDVLQDLAISLKQSEDICKINIKNIKSLRDSYQILFTNDVNKAIKILTAITILFTIPTIIASFYGMNVSLPFEKNEHAFLIIFNITILFSILVYILFIRKKWI